MNINEHRTGALAYPELELLSPELDSSREGVGLVCFVNTAHDMTKPHLHPL